MKRRAILGRFKNITKRRYTCVGGPMHMMKLWLSSTPTLVFTLKGKTGRYELPKMNGRTKLKWVDYG